MPMKKCKGCNNKIIPAWTWCNDCGRKVKRQREKKKYVQKKKKRAEKKEPTPKPLTMQEIKHNLAEALKRGDEVEIKKWRKLYDAQVDFDTRVAMKRKERAEERVRILREQSYNL